ncbi:hypothetical protein SDC9_127775 [bioreactor metagenome]|uniref:Uncharacterized protein n=1 Tax=bioreactor metagenome TaxID=1076179 RepID=A0A645CV22_9ZZZZ
MQQSPGQMQALGHAAGVCFYAIIPAGTQPHQIQQVWNAFAADFSIQRVEFGKVLQVLHGSKTVIQASATAECKANVFADFLGLLHHIQTQDGGRSAARQEQSGQHLDRGRFPSAIRTQQAEKLTLFD